MMCKTTLLPFLMVFFCLVGFQVAAQTTLPDIDVSGSVTGVVNVPETADPAIRAVFGRYSKLETPNGKAIHILAPIGTPNELIVRARSILGFYLTDVDNTDFGTDKSAIANAMGNKGASLLFFSDEAAAEAAFDSGLDEHLPNSQALYLDEVFLEGSSHYLENTNRDASFEEILHLVHDYGIMEAAPVFQQQIQVATDEARTSEIWTSEAMAEWIAEGSTTQEYLATIVDVYYGLWGHDASSDGTAFYGEYLYDTREELAMNDPKGQQVIEAFFPPFLDYTADIDRNFKGTFSLTFTPSKAYTHKSQYLLNARLTGTLDSGLEGNEQNNHLWGNRGNNVLSGGNGNDIIDGDRGDDTAVFQGKFSEYNSMNFGEYVIVSDYKSNRDAIDTLYNVEFILFSDRSMSVDNLPMISVGLSDGNNNGGMRVYPNPMMDILTLELENDWFGDIQLQVYNMSGQMVYGTILGKYTSHFQQRIALSELKQGMYVVELRNVKNGIGTSYEETRHVLSVRVVKE